MNKKISFIVPILNEEECLSRNLDHYHDLRKLESEKISIEILFIDGGSQDQSREILIQNNFEVILSEPGRAKQLNTGVEYSSGDSFVFLHADTHMPENSKETLSVIANQRWGFFKMALSNRSKCYRFLSSAINTRSQLFHYATGDQVLFFSRDMFLSMGGYADLSLMEDIEITRRAKKVCRPYIIQSRVISSSRKWERNGFIKTIFFMWFIQLCYILGVKTGTLEKWYYPKRLEK